MLLFREIPFLYLHSVHLVAGAASAAAVAAGADSAPAAAAARRLRCAGGPLPPPPACACAGQPPLGLRISSLQSELSTNVTELQPAIAATLHEPGPQLAARINIEALSISKHKASIYVFNAYIEESSIWMQSDIEENAFDIEDSSRSGGSHIFRPFFISGCFDIEYYCIRYRNIFFDIEDQFRTPPPP
jgi:hypothetical protein